MFKKAYAPVIGLLALTLAGCEAGTPNTYDMSVAEIKQKLVGKESSYKSGTQTRFMKATGPSAEGLRLRLWNDVSWEKNCELRFTTVEEGKTQIVPFCGTAVSATSEVPMAFVHTEIEEHVKQILTGEPVDEQYIMMKMTALTAKNIPAMQGEAIKADIEMRAERIRQDQESGSDDWASEPGDDLSDDWGS